MFDPVQAQEDLVGALLSDQRLSLVAVKSYRRMRLEQEINWRLILEGRGALGNAKVGAGILVAMPVATSRNPNVSGPVLDWTFPVISLENPQINFVKQTGTLLSAEELAQTVLDVLQHYGDEKTGAFYADPTPIQPERELSFPGCIGYRTTLHVLGRSMQTARVGTLAVQVAPDGSGGWNVTLSTSTVGATIRYTTDGSFPSAKLANNASASDYTGPISGSSGDVIRAAAYADGLVGSPLRYITLQ